MKKITPRFLAGIGLIYLELFGRLFLAALMLSVLAVIGGLAVMGGSQMETDNPNAFDGLGGYEIIYLMFDIYIPLIMIIPLWILVAFRERQIYNVVKGFILDRKEKKPIPKIWWYMVIAIIIFVTVKIIWMEFGYDLW